MIRPRPKRGPLTEPARRLAGDPASLAVARKVVAYHGRLHPALADEFESAAHVAIVQAAGRFDPTKGRSWRNYLYARLQGAMLDVRRDWTPGFRKGGRPPIATVEPLGAVDFDRIPPSPAPPVGHEAEGRESAEAMLARLGPSARRLMRSIYVEGVADTPWAAASLAGLSTTWAAIQHRRSLETLRDSLEVA
jgi:DNA-directed RNA polymerase specialized sigma24 family protein